MRTGLIVKKIGMLRLFDELGKHVPVTVLASSDCVTVGQKTQERDGYTAVQVGAGTTTSSRLSKSEKGFFEGQTERPLRRKLVEFRVSEDHMLAVGAPLEVDHYRVGDWVDVTATSKGKGFQGGMKRWGFGGLRASHGVSVAHRSHGSTGQRSLPARVFKNKKMAGHMGCTRVTQQSLKVMFVDVEKGLLCVKGCVPGPKEGYVLLRDAIKKQACAGDKK